MKLSGGARRRDGNAGMLLKKRQKQEAFQRECQRKEKNKVRLRIRMPINVQ
jgi:hypothetical protein